jgi:hypothetical protein
MLENVGSPSKQHPGGLVEGHVLGVALSLWMGFVGKIWRKHGFQHEM